MPEAEPLLNVFQPTLGRAELDAVARVFETSWPGRGTVTREFEAAFADHISTERSLVCSVNSCTEGLFQAVELLGIGAGDEVVMPTISFVGMGNAVAARGATPVFCDVDPRTLNATAATIEAVLSERTRAVAVLHYGGVPCEIREIGELARSRGVALIEDSACSVSSCFEGVPCGTFGDVGVWSFDSMKILVTGDGGMMRFRDVGLAQRAAEALYLGLRTPSGLTSTANDRWWEFDISSFGRRSIMNDIVAAIGIEQLRRLPSFVERRREIHEEYDRAFDGLEGIATPPPINPHTTSSYYLYWLQLEPGKRDALAQALRRQQVYTTFRYFPLHLVAGYGSTASLPAAEQAARSTLCIPIHQAMSDADVARVVAGVRDFIR